MKKRLRVVSRSRANSSSMKNWIFNFVLIAFLFILICCAVAIFSNGTKKNVTGNAISKVCDAGRVYCSSEFGESYYKTCNSLGDGFFDSVRCPISGQVCVVHSDGYGYCEAANK